MKRLVRWIGLLLLVLLALGIGLGAIVFASFRGLSPIDEGWRLAPSAAEVQVIAPAHSGVLARGLAPLEDYARAR